MPTSWREDKRRVSELYTPGEAVFNFYETTMWLTEDVDDVSNFERIPRHSLLTVIEHLPKERFIRVLFGSLMGWIDKEDLQKIK